MVKGLKGGGGELEEGAQLPLLNRGCDRVCLIS